MGISLGDRRVRMAQSAGRWVLVATVLGSSMAALDSTVVNVALPAISRDLGVGVAGMQWVLTGYLITLSALILLGGALGDRFGRRKVFVIGTVWFALASALCSLAPNLPVLVAARALQGAGGALLMPGSLAIIQASFAEEDRGAAIGAWSGLGGITTALGPLVGGWLVQTGSWRLIFVLNLPLALIVILVALKHVPESLDQSGDRGLDLKGAALGVIGLAASTYALIEAPAEGVMALPVLVAGIGGILGLVLFAVTEARSRHPMLPLGIFRSRQFTAANLVTFAVYGALGGVFFLLVVDLQQVLGYSPVQAGSAALPVTAIMLTLSSRTGRLAQKIGPRLPMTVGPLLVASGMLLMTRIDVGSSYLATILPALVVFGLGLALTVAPLTATVLAAAEERYAGTASAVNNAVARVAGLMAVAVLPVAADLVGPSAQDPAGFSAGFHTAMRMTAAIAAAGGGVAWLTIRQNQMMANRAPVSATQEPEMHCALDAPPLGTRA